MVVSVVRIFLIRQKRQIRQIQLYGNQALSFSNYTLGLTGDKTIFSYKIP